MKTVKISTPYITLGQFLKYIDIASSGGAVKSILRENKIRVDGEIETRRGKKLYPGSTVSLEDETAFRIEAGHD